MEKHVINEGSLQVGSGHYLYWQLWGNPDAENTILFNHGGPGAYFHDGHKALFDPLVNKVLFYDQRGCGKSTPFASIEENTTQDLIADIESLRRLFNIEQFIVGGGSWGSTLSLLYAMKHKERVRAMFIWSIYLIRQFETDFVNDGRLEVFYPEAWRRFVALVPMEHRNSGDDIMKYYARMINSEDSAIATRYADEWTLWEMTLTSINYDRLRTEKEVIDDPNNLAIARLETHYFINGCFVPENYILDNISVLRGVPCYAVHGRLDMCTPVISAIDLKNAWPELDLKIVDSGHIRSDPEMFAAIRAITTQFR